MFYCIERAEIETEQGKWITEPRWINTDRLSLIYYQKGYAYFILDYIELPDDTVLTNRFRVSMDYDEFIGLPLGTRLVNQT